MLLFECVTHTCVCQANPGTPDIPRDVANSEASCEPLLCGALTHTDQEVPDTSDMHQLQVRTLSHRYVGGSAGWTV